MTSGSDMVKGSVLLHEQNNMLDVLQRPDGICCGGEGGEGRRIPVDTPHPAVSEATEVRLII